MAHHLGSLTPSLQAVVNKYAASLLPLTASRSAAPEAALLRTAPAGALFPGARHPEAAVSGLLLQLHDWAGSHHVSQDLDSPEGSYWHAIAHRMEPDSSNAAYWFRRVGTHPVFSALRERASAILSQSSQTHWRLQPAWDPFRFIEWCDEARHQPGTPPEQVALAIQQAEWELLFAWCSQPPHF